MYIHTYTYTYTHIYYIFIHIYTYEYTHIYTPKQHKQMQCARPGSIHLFAYVMGGRVGMSGTHFSVSQLR